MRNLLRELRYAVRQLGNAPGFAVTAVVTLGLGIGATTAIFSCVYGLLLKSLPFQDEGALVAVEMTHPQVVGGVEATFQDYLDWGRQQSSFQQLAAYSTNNPPTVALRLDGRAEQVNQVLASGNFFAALGVTPQAGRLLDEQDNAAGKDNVAVLSAGAWQRYFGRDAGAVGRVVALNGTNYTIVGVLPEGAAFPADGDVWLPLSRLDAATQASRVWHSVRVVGRLRPGVSLAQARADMEGIGRRLAVAYPATNKREGVAVELLHQQMVSKLRPAMLFLMGAVVLVLLVACANVANLLLVRATAQQREVALRRALGAQSGRLYAQFLSHALLLCLLGGAAGVALAAGALPLLRAALAHTEGSDAGMLRGIGLNVPVLLFALGTCTVTALVFGLVPVMKGSLRLVDALGTGDRGSSARQRGRGVLMTAEVAIAVVVVFLSTLVVRSFERLVATDPGFQTDHLLSAEVNLPQPQYAEGTPATNQFYQQVLEKLGQAHGVVSAATTTQVPLKPSLGMTRFLVEGAEPLAPGTFPFAQIRTVSPDFFRTAGLGLLEGRTFTRTDVDDPVGFFVVNRAFARRYLAGRDAVGARILIGVMSKSPVKIPVVGVVSDWRDLGVDTAPEPEIYLPGYGLHSVFLVRSTVDPQSVARALRDAVHAVAPLQPVYHVETVDGLLADSMARQRMTASLLGIFAMVALVLAAVGTFGVLSYSVAQRRREIGLRMAVGAERGSIVRLVVRQAAGFTAVGVAAGLAAGLAGARLIGGLLFEVRWADPVSVSIAVGALLLVTLLAAVLPARRAASVNPVEALRAE